MIFSSFSFLREHIHLPLCRSRIPSPRRLGTFLLALILLPLSYVLGAFAATVIPAVPASADGNWGLSFQQEGKPPVANATADELKQYNAWYADLSGEKVIYLTFDARIRERQHSLDPGCPEKASGFPPRFSLSGTTWRPARTS